MSNEKISDLNKKVSEQVFFEFLNSFDINDYLDSRDTTPFDLIWMENFNRVERLNFTDGQLDEINKIRENCYKSVLRATGNSELASYVVDDFEIICKDIIHDNLNEWTIVQLLGSYENKTLPF